MKFLVAVAFLLVGLAECFQYGDVRLFQDYNVGRLEVFIDGEWGSVCFDSDQDQRGMAQAVCRQLGLRNFLRVTKLSDEPSYVDNNTNPVLSKVFCGFSNNPDYAERHILRCKHNTAPDQCSSDDEVFIECDMENIDAEAYNTMVRLVKFSVPEISTGVLEVFLNGDWGAVCKIDQPNADTACRQLGYTGAASFGTYENYTDNPFVLDGFTCETAETCLRKCFEYPKAEDEISCGSDEASVVTCTFDEEANDGKYGSRSACQDSGLSAGAIAGIAIGSVVGVVVLLLVVVAALFCLLPKCKSKKTKYDAI